MASASARKCNERKLRMNEQAHTAARRKWLNGLRVRSVATPLEWRTIKTTGMKPKAHRKKLSSTAG